VSTVGTKQEQRNLERKRKLDDEKEKTVNSLRTAWVDEVLPKWSKQSRLSKRVEKLCWEGIPSSVRPRAWRAIIGNDLKITPELFEIMRERAVAAHDKAEAHKLDMPASTDSGQHHGLDVNREHTLAVIDVDIPRTFPHLKIFHEGGPLHSQLLDLLRSYVVYRPDVGYVQGMSYIACVFLLNMDTCNAFVALANLLHQDLYYTFFRMDVKAMNHHVQVFCHFFAQELPALSKHFSAIGVTPDMFLYEWVLTVFCRSLPLDIVHRIWDSFLLHPAFLFRASLGLLRLLSPLLLNTSMEGTLGILNHIPQNISEHDLFAHIKAVRVDPGRFESMLEALQDRDSRGV